jgi:hypothetical protein
MRPVVFQTNVFFVPHGGGEVALVVNDLPLRVRSADRSLITVGPRPYESAFRLVYHDIGIGESSLGAQSIATQTNIGAGHADFP